MIEKYSSGSGQRNTARPAFEKFYANFHFEIMNLTTQ